VSPVLAQSVLTPGGEIDFDEVTEEEVEAQVAEEVEAQITQQAEDASEDALENEVEAMTEEAAEDYVQQNTEEQVEASIEEQVVEAAEEASIDAVEEGVLAATEDRIVNTVDELIDDIEVGIENEAYHLHRGQWLVMAEPKIFDELAREGYIFDTFTELPGLGLRLAQVAAPASFDINKTREGIFDVVGSGRAEVDLNHIYTAGVPEEFPEQSGVAPGDVLKMPDDIHELPLRVGIVDSAVDESHAALRNAKLTVRHFIAINDDTPQFHGTAITSILVGVDGDYRGLAPNAELFMASVFEYDREQGEIASTVSLVRSLDWLLSTGVDVINLSLAGPPNRLLEVALNRVIADGVTVLAAAGNGGPSAEPMYPAAYSDVIAVTAVDRLNKPFRLANRGRYIDIAAPGVQVRHAQSGGGYSLSSGTSFAVPFASLAAARLRHLSPDQNPRDFLLARALDLGETGRDDIFGYGLLMP
jgi:hypothetical protein